MAKSITSAAARVSTGARAQARVVMPPAAVAAMAIQSAGARLDYLYCFRADPLERVQIVKARVPVAMFEKMARGMDIPKNRLARTLGISGVTMTRKARENVDLSTDDSSRVLGMARLIGQVQSMVEESGTSQDFDAAGWVAHWLETPLAALGGTKPADLMDTLEGQGIVSDLVSRMQSGAYA